MTSFFKPCCLCALLLACQVLSAQNKFNFDIGELDPKTQKAVGCNGNVIAVDTATRQNGQRSLLIEKKISVLPIIQSRPISKAKPSGLPYTGKVVVIVNSYLQSQAEYKTMAFHSAPNVTVIGSTNAGADGNISQIFLSGNIRTVISGIGVYYPNGTET
jgi:Periplasmic protease